MISKIRIWARRELDGLKASEQGERFRDRYHRSSRPGSLKRVVLVCLGLGLVGAGILMLIFPGPGLVGILLGLGVLSGQMLIFARLLDWLEVEARHILGPLIRRWEGSKHKRFWAILAVLLTSAITFAITLGTARLLGTPLPFGLDEWP